jgi:predicted permease
MRWYQRLLRRARTEKQLDAELRFHLAQQIADHVATGMTPEEARRRARLEFGGLDQVKEECRDVYWENHLRSFFRDIRFALRMLHKDRHFALIAIFTLALGIGSATLIFSVVDHLLFPNLPYENASRYTSFSIRNLDPAGGSDISAFPLREFLAIQQQNHVFEDVVGATGTLGVRYTRRAGTEVLGASIVTTNTFRVLGVKPLLGRPITAADGAPGSPPVFVMSYGLWMRQFNGDPKILGTSLDLNGEPTTLVGIMPPRFTSYFGAGSLWLPLRQKNNGQQLSFYPIAVRKPGVSLEQAAADLNVISRGLSKLYPREFPLRFKVLTGKYSSELGPLKGVLYPLFAAVMMLLLIACSNVASLLLARTTAREKEIAIRAALGATRSQLIRQVLVESFVVAAAGGVLGWLFAYGGLKVVIAFLPSPPFPPAETEITLNTAVAAFAVAVTALTTLPCGLAPALHVARGDLQATLAAGNTGVSGTRPHGRFRAGVVIAQVALSTVLFVGAGLMARTFLAVVRAHLGYNPQKVVFAGLSLPPAYKTAEKRIALFQTVLRHVDAYPGVISATVASSLPFSAGAVTEAEVPGKVHSQPWHAGLELCSEGYFRTLEVKIVRGRVLSESDVDSSRHVAVINQSLGRKFFGTEDPIGRTLKFTLFHQKPQTPHYADFEIIGVVADMRNRGLKNSPMPQAFVPYTIPELFKGAGILVRTATTDSIWMGLRRQAWFVQRGLTLGHSGTLETKLEIGWYTTPRFDLFTLGTLAGISLVLITIGVFNLMSYSVPLRTHEIGVRMALGARPGAVLKMVMADGFILIAPGVALGVLASLALTRLIANQVWGVSTRDPLTFVAVIVVTVAAGLMACWLPARRAAQVDPLVALRYE